MTDVNPASRFGSIRAQVWLAAAVLVVAVIVAYGGALAAPFLFDDTDAVLENPTIRHLVSPEVLRPPRNGSASTGRPIVNLSFALNYALSGERVGSYHALNIAIHAGAALVLLGIARRTLLAAPLRERFGAHAMPLALAIAGVWALHPLQTESVVCIAQRTESLCGFFLLLTLYAFIRGAEPGPGSRAWRVFSVVSCLCGMAAKEVMVGAPLLVLLYDRAFLSGTFSAALRQRRGYYAALAGTWLLLAVLAGTRGTAAGFGLGISPWHYLLTQCSALLIYLKLALWPHPLVLDYGTNVVRSVAAVWWQGAVVLGLLGAAVWALVRRPMFGFLGAWFFVILAPSSSVVPLVTQTIAEHRMYLPLASIVVLLAFLCHRVAGNRAAWILGVVALGFGGLTVARTREYGDVVAIWADTVIKAPQNARAHNNLAWALQQQGKSAAANEHFARAIALQPDYLAAHYSWGVALLDQGKSDEAIAQFEAAVRLGPEHVGAQLNLGNALVQVRRDIDAIPHYEEALRLKAGADAHYNLGVALTNLNRNDEARRHFQAALQENPDLAEAHYRLGRLAELAGDFAGAERSYGETLRRNPRHVDALAHLGLVLARTGQLDAAAERLRLAVQLAPTHADAHAFLGTVLLLQEKPREAITSFETALRLRPDDPRTRQNLRLAREALR